METVIATDKQDTCNIYADPAVVQEAGLQKMLLRASGAANGTPMQRLDISNRTPDIVKIRAARRVQLTTQGTVIVHTKPFHEQDLRDIQTAHALLVALGNGDVPATLKKLGIRKDDIPKVLSSVMQKVDRLVAIGETTKKRTK